MILPSKFMECNIIHSCMIVRKRRGFVMLYQLLPNKMGLVNITHKFPNGDEAAAVEMSNKNEIYIFYLLLPKVHIITSKKGLGVKIRVKYTEGTRFTSSKFNTMSKLRPIFILP